MKLRVRYHVSDDLKDLFRLKRIEKGDWIDLRTSETIELHTGEVYTVPLGVAIELPEGYEAYVAPRSSMLPKYGIIGVFGIIDNSYRGEDDIWHLQFYATRDGLIEVGTRIAQFRITEKMPLFQIEEVDELGNPSRGGLGTTGHQ